jgi:hypothetical protein
MYTIAAILVVLWLFGVISSHTMGGFLHLLLAVAVVVVMIRFIRGGKPL